MEKKRQRKSSIIDDLCTVKAAAWAWYEHGSGSEGMPVPEYDLTKTHNPPPAKPSRFKIEAMNTIQESSTPVHHNHPLLDAYEVERISKQLDSFILSSSNRFSEAELNKNKDLDRQNSVSSTASSSSSYNNTANKLKKKKNNFLKGLWLRHSAVCGIREDFDSTAHVPKMAGKRVSVVRLAVCRPRITHA